MSHTPQVYLVCYDICAPGRLRRVYRILRGFGDALQYSVFRCTLSEVQLARLKDRLSGALNAAEDQVLFVRLGPEDARTTWRAFTLGVPLVHPERVARIV
jgi:CRISPR-associated protein Cas2